MTMHKRSPNTRRALNRAAERLQLRFAAIERQLPPELAEPRRLLTSFLIRHSLFSRTMPYVYTDTAPELPSPGDRVTWRTGRIEGRRIVHELNHGRLLRQRRGNNGMSLVRTDGGAEQWLPTRSLTRA